jgi:L-idonate 5-dehydrogenase
MTDPHEHNHAVVIHGAHDVRVEQRPMPTLGDIDVLVRVQLGGICGSDLSYYRKGAVGDFKVLAPMILGHEIVGHVRDAGSSVHGFDDGTHVLVDPSSPCGSCDRCKEARFNICERPRFLGSASTTPHSDGGFASFVGTRRQNLVRVPAGTIASQAVFAEPLAVTVHAINRAGGVQGARILVVGAGPIGSLLVASAGAMGAAEITVTDLDPSRLERAKQVGAHTTILAGEEDAGTNYDLVFEASGAAPAIQDAVTRVRRGGRFVMVGLPHGAPVAMPLSFAIPREIDVVGSFRFNHAEFVQAVDLIGNGLDLSPLLSGTVAATAAPDAFIVADAPQSLKVQLDFTAV